MAELRVVRHTHRFDDAARFYGELLGWPVTKAWDEPARGRIYGYGDTARVEIIDTGHDDASPPGTAISIEAESVEAVHDALVQAGVELARPLAVQPWGHRNFAVTDPTGMAVTFFEELA